MDVCRWKFAQQIELVCNGRGVVVQHQSSSPSARVHETVIENPNALFRKPCQRFLLPLLVETLKITTTQLADDNRRAERAFAVS